MVTSSSDPQRLIQSVAKELHHSLEEIFLNTSIQQKFTIQKIQTGVLVIQIKFLVPSYVHFTTLRPFQIRCIFRMVSLDYLG
jgi:hypothetical protein